MPVAFKVDEDLPAEVAEMLHSAGHDAQTVIQQGLGGTADTQLWDVVQRERRCLITADKGFANAELFPPETHHGIVLLRLPRESRTGYVSLTELLLKSLDLTSIIGAIVVVTPAGIRIHRGR